MNIKNNKDLEYIERDKDGYIPVHRNPSPLTVEDGRVKIASRKKEQQQNYLADFNENNKKVVSELDDFVSVTELPMEEEPKNTKNKGNKKKNGTKENKNTKDIKKSPEQLSKLPFHPDRKINDIIKKRFDNLKIKKISNDSDFVDLYMQCYKGYIRYNVDECQWYCYTGKYWKVDNEYTVYNCAIKLDYEINRMLKKSTLDKAILKQINLYGNHVAIKNILEMAKTRGVCHSENFDQCPYLLNVRNGTVNLKTKELQEHKPKDMITQFIDVDYNLDATGGRFGEFISEICAYDKELAKYLQVVYGYALTGETREQCFFLEKGNGANGKSTLNEVISEIVHAYLGRVDFTLFQRKQYASANSPTPELAKLIGKRIVLCSETNDNQLNEAKIKEITGGTRITARALRKDPFTYTPKFTIIFDGNNLPTIKGTDNGIWRRIVVIPFDCTFKKDITLKDTLLNEKKVILKWLVDGAYKYYNNGLPKCKAVKKATESYRAEENTVEAFIKYGIIEDSDSKCSAKDLYSAYEQYCINCCSSPVSIKTFKAAIMMNGYKNKRTNKGMFWIGICPKDDIC